MGYEEGINKPPDGVIKVTIGMEADPIQSGNSIYIVPSADSNDRMDFPCYIDREIKDYAPRGFNNLAPSSDGVFVVNVVRH